MCCDQAPLAFPHPASRPKFGGHSLVRSHPDTIIAQKLDALERVECGRQELSRIDANERRC
jgi:hypothetical protein